MKKIYSHVARVVYLIILLFIFYWEFGKPAYDKYRTKGIFVSKTTQDMTEESAPSITVWAAEANSTLGFELGWKNVKNFPSSGSFNLEFFCPENQTLNAIENCYRDKTIKISEAILKSSVGSQKEFGVFDWETKMTYIPTGKWFTLTKIFPIGSTMLDAFHLSLNKSYKGIPCA